MEANNEKLTVVQLIVLYHRKPKNPNSLLYYRYSLLQLL
jgi:hypothetical protein